MAARFEVSTEPGERLIRRLDDGDLSAVMAIEAVAYDFPWSLPIFADCLRAGYACHGMFDQGVLQGYAIVSRALDEAHLLNLCIRQEARGQGLAEIMLDHVLTEAELAGVDRCFLEVRPSNKPARRLYQKSGFRMIGRRPGYYPSQGGREDAWVMMCHLSERPRLEFEHPPADRL